RPCLLDLRVECAQVAIGGIELLRRRGLLIEETLRAVVCPPGNRSLRLENTDLFVDFVHARAADAALCLDLLKLQHERRRIDHGDRFPRRDLAALGRRECLELSARLGADDDLGRFDIAVGIRGRGLRATGNEHERESEGLRALHHGTSTPSVVSKLAWAWAR